jgi:uncharacterized membrane protein
MLHTDLPREPRRIDRARRTWQEAGDFRNPPDAAKPDRCAQRRPADGPTAGRMVGIGQIRGAVTGRLWVRAALYGLAAVAVAALSRPLARVVPAGFHRSIDQGQVQSLLEIMASSMLVIASFSLGAMVSATTAAATIATPRASRILIDDPLAQSALATFVGAFVFAVVALGGLSLGYYGDESRVLLLFATAAVFAAVIMTLFGWVDYLANLVRLGAVLNKVEARAEQALADRREAPRLGGRPVVAGGAAVHPVPGDQLGYITGIDVADLQRIAEAAGGVVRVEALPGTFADTLRPLAAATWQPSGPDARAIAATFTIGAERELASDPRFGLVVLAEVASRALSPGVNDPGTAIGIIGRLERLIALWARSEQGNAVDFDRVEVPALDAADLVEDAFAPLARDAAPIVEVGGRLQKALATVARLGDRSLARAATEQSARALAAAEAALPLASDQARLAELAARVAP